MNDIWETQRAKEKIERASFDAWKQKQFGKRHFKFSSDRVNELLEILLPQHFDSATSAIRTALSQIDPSWQKGQFQVFSKHFRMYLFRSLFTSRFLLNESRVSVLAESQILEKILQVSQHLDDNEKAAFYGTVLSEYILRCPETRLPVWSDAYRDRPNWIIIWNLHSTLWQYFYW